jgi:hypothetical protein
MICPKCKFEMKEDLEECPRCGVVFSKLRAPGEKPYTARNPADAKQRIDKGQAIQELFFHVSLDTNPFYLAGRVLLFIVLLYYGWTFILTPPESPALCSGFWHLVNLPFHEAGHILFRPFGRLVTSLGGSLGQLLMPLVCLAVFLFATKDPFAGSVTLWWFGQNFIDLAPYVHDARALALPLLGGNTGRNAPYGFHDWEFILNELGLLRYDHTIAQVFHKTGIVILLLACVWGGYLLVKQFRTLMEPQKAGT